MVSRDVATKRKRIQGVSWNTTRKQWEKRHDLKAQYTNVICKKMDEIRTPKQNHNDLVHDLDGEHHTSKKVMKVASKSASRNEQLAKDHVSKMKTMTSTVDDFQKELLSENDCCIELEKEVEELSIWKPRVVEK